MYHPHSVIHPPFLCIFPRVSREFSSVMEKGAPLAQRNKVSSLIPTSFKLVVTGRTLGPSKATSSFVDDR